MPHTPTCADVLIIGSGLAGMTLALSLPATLRITLLSKGPVDECASAWAQGGIAAVLDASDSLEAHVQDTLIAGAGLCDEAAVRRILEQGPQAIAWLQALGVPFSTDAGGRLHLTREGGHSARRIAHAADRTGMAVHQTLLKACQRLKHITLLQHCTAMELLQDAQQRCVGASVRNADGHQQHMLASHTVLATGGMGQLYTSTTNPATTTGDGIAMAWRAGLPVRNMEFFQFHPTCLFHRERRNFLITEALRGEGAILYNLAGERFMERYDPERMELAPRDIVARAIDSEMKRLGHDHVVLDARSLGRKALEERFPEVTEGVLSVGIRPWEEPIPVVPAAHYCVGGVVAGIDGSTEMEGLRVVGEAASTGLHGANRLGSNSLLEAGVMGIESAHAIAGTIHPLPAGLSVRDWYFGRARPLEESVLIDHDWAAVRSTMWDYVGIIRSDRRLRRALRILDVISREVEEDYWSLLPQKDLLELRNLCDVAGIIVRSALLRRESRGLHYNLDCPDPVPPGRDTVVRH